MRTKLRKPDPTQQGRILLNPDPRHTGLLQWGLDNRYCIFLSTHCTNYVIINQIIIIMRKTYDSIPIQMVERMEK